jgi:ABC-type antimicrobial peptide transport system permease subunit
MNRSTLRKIYGDLWTHKGRTILVAISIFIGVLGVVTLITAGDLLVQQMREDIKESELRMLEMRLNILPGDDEDEFTNESYLDDLREEFPAITEIEGASNNPTYWRFVHEGRFREAQLFAYTSPFDGIELEPMYLVDGEYPQTGQNQLAIEQRMAEDFDIQVGDVLDIRVLGKEGFPTELWTISGIVFHAYNRSPQESLFTNYDDAELITGTEGLNSLAIRFTDFENAETEQEAIQAFFSENTPYSVPTVRAIDPAQNQKLETSEQFATILSMLAVVVVLVSGFLVLNVINNLVIEQKRHIGTMKSLGVTRTETFIIYGGIAVIYGVMGVIPGVLVGIPVGYEMAVIIGDFTNTLIGDFSISSLAVTLGIVLGLFVPIVSAIIPVYTGTRVTILEAMTDMGIGSNYQVGIISRIIKRLPLPLNLKQSLNNLTQKKARLALTMITLTFAITAFMGVSAVFVQIDDILQNVSETFDFQIIIQPTETQTFEAIQALVMENVEGVEEVRNGAMYFGQLDGYLGGMREGEIMLQGVIPETAFNMDVLVEGTAWNDDPDRKGIVLSTEITNALDKNSGDFVVLTIAGQPYELEIIGIINLLFPMGVLSWEDLAVMSGYTLGAPTPNQYFTSVQIDGYSGTLPENQISAWGIDEQAAMFITMLDGASLSADQSGVILSEEAALNGDYAVGDMLTMTTTGNTAEYPVVGIFALPPQIIGQMPTDLMAFYWQDLAALEGLSLDGTPVPNAFFVMANGEQLSAREVDELIEAINNTLVDNGITASFTNLEEITEQASDAILSIGIILNIASGLMAAVGAIGLITTLSIAVFERQKEIGVMRSVGAKSPTIVMQFLVEGILVGVLAWIVAVPLSVALAWVLNSALPFGDFVQFSYPMIMLPLGFVGVLIIATISSVWPSVSAARKTVSDILRYQ